MVSWREGIGKFLYICRLGDRGIPHFVKMGDYVLGRCWGGIMRTYSVRFKDVPKEDLEIIESEVGEWRIFAERYLPEGLAEQVLGAEPIPRTPLPRR